MLRKIFILLLLIGTCSSYGQIARLHVEGRNIYDQNDSLVMLRGFNWGWWGEALPEDAGIIKNEVGGNAVRLALRWYYWGGTDKNNPMNARDSLSPGNIKPEFLTLLDSYIEWLTREEIWTILFINSDQGAGKNEKHFFNTPYLKEEFLETWKFLANRYKETPYIGAFELMAEPQYQRHKRDVSPQKLVGWYKEIADSINTITESSIPFVIGPQNYYLPDSLLDVYHLEAYQVIYAANMFKPSDYCRGDADLTYPSAYVNKESIETYYDVPLQFREKFNVPVWVDQWGASRISNGYVEYTKDVLDFLERNELHWTYWNWRQFSGDRGIFERYPKWSGDYQFDTLLFELFQSVLLDDECQNNTSSISDTACESYTSPGGKIWTVSGTYQDTIPNSAGCDSIITIALTFDCPGSLLNNNALALSIYPNPVKDVLNIELEEHCDVLVIELYDYTGKIITRKNYKNIKQLTYRIEGPPGNYLIKLSNTEDEISVSRVIKR